MLIAAMPHVDLFAVLVLFVLPMICGMKGKWGFAIFGLIVPLLWLIGSIRLAKPESFWAERWYDSAEMQQAEHRFGRTADGYPPAPTRPL